MDTIHDHIADSYEQMLGASEEGFEQYLKEYHPNHRHGIQKNPEKVEALRDRYWKEYLEHLETAQRAKQELARR